VELTTPRIAALVLATVSVSAFVGGWGPPAPWLLIHTLLGTALVAASASALNQWLERNTDALMPRTAERPLPAGRLSAVEVLLFGAATIILGSLWLALMVNLLTAVLGLVTWALYVWVYTPLKSRSEFNTVVGAVAGAMPALLGWSAVGASFALDHGGPGLKAATLFLIVYLWQFPHFMAIAWIYRQQYGAAGLKMLTVIDPSGRRAGAQAVAASLALVPVSLLPAVHLAGPVYLLAALVLGVSYLTASVVFCLRRDEGAARHLLHASLLYLPTLLVFFLFVPLV
jgi:protoheme IX farnesyltransferase